MAQEIVNLISNVGFPIACTVALFWQLEKQREAHKEEMAKTVEAVNNNTLVMQQVVTKLDDLTRKEETNHEA